MTRPFDIRDVGLLQRLAATARPLACWAAAVDGLYPLREAMRAYVSAGRDAAVVLVDRAASSSEDGAFGMMQMLPTSEPHQSTTNPTPRWAVLTMLGAQSQGEARLESWERILLGLVAEAAQRGVHHIVTESPESGPEWEALQAAGFVPLLQQDLLKVSLPLEGGGHAGELPGLREQGKDDEPLIRLLHQRIAPKMTYPAEAALDQFVGHHLRRGWLLTRNNELVAYAAVHQGRRGYGLQLLFRPEAEEDARSMLEHCLARLRGSAYVTVRHHHSWLLPVLDQLGFVHLTSTVLMVRHVAAKVQQPVWSHAVEHAAIYTTRSAMHITWPPPQPHGDKRGR
ncbi:MAG: hypothetical protein ACK4WM_01030 [Thermoflexales bacterium]